MLTPLLRLDDPVVLLLSLLNPVVPVLLELPTLPEPAAPAAVSPLPAPCPKAMDEVTARTEAKPIVVSFMWFFPAVVA
jgi:hypothetical protein